jgi:hypothetical protein
MPFHSYNTARRDIVTLDSGRAMLLYYSIENRHKTTGCWPVAESFGECIAAPHPAIDSRGAGAESIPHAIVRTDGWSPRAMPEHRQHICTTNERGSYVLKPRTYPTHRPGGPLAGAAVDGSFDGAGVAIAYTPTAETRRAYPDKKKGVARLVV